MKHLLLTVLALMALLGVAQSDPTPEQTKEAQALIAQFTSPEFAVRQKAVEELIKMGPGGGGAGEEGMTQGGS